MYLQKKNEHLIDKFSDGDCVFIYETKNLSGQEVEVESNGDRRTVKLRRGRGGIIALVRIGYPFKRGRWKWNGIPFIGYFDTSEVTCGRSSVPLSEINGERRRRRLPNFNPRVNGGLRRLRRKEFSVMSRLIGATEIGRGQ